MTDAKPDPPLDPTLVFTGTVRQVGESNVREVPRRKETCVVKIERILLAPPTFADLSGEVTVLLPPNRQVATGDRRTFHCVGWILGSGVALRALDVTSSSEDRALAADVAAVDPSEAFLMRELSKRVELSELVVGGYVTDVRSVPVDQTARRISEHDPDWHEAVLQVESVSKGEPPRYGVVVTFPLSRDINWHRSPKFQVGQRGVWLLRSLKAAEIPKEAAARLADRSYPIFTALDPLDFQPESEAHRVTTLARPK